MTSKENELAVTLSARPSINGLGPSEAMPTTVEGSCNSEHLDRGLVAWGAVLGAFLIQFNGLGYSSSFGVFQDYYTRFHLSNSSPAAISRIGGSSALSMTVLSLFTGVLYDRGYFYHMLYAGSFLTSFSLFMLSLTEPNKYYQVYLSQGVGLGIGGGLLYLPTLAVLAEHFKVKLPIAMIIAHNGSSLGAIIHPLMLNRLFAMRSLGFANSMRASAGLVSGMLLVACCLIREGKNRSPKPQQQESAWRVFKRSMKDTPYLCFCLSFTAFAMGIYFPAFYLQICAVLHDVDPSFVSYMYSVMSGISLVGGLVPLLIAKYVGFDILVVVAGIMAAGSAFGMAGVHDLASTAGVMVFFGIGIGLFFNLEAPMIAKITTNQAELGSRMGFAFTFLGIGSAIGPMIHGALLSRNFIWWRPSVFSGVFLVAATIGFALTPILSKAQRRSLPASDNEKQGGQA